MTADALHAIEQKELQDKAAQEAQEAFLAEQGVPKVLRKKKAAEPIVNPLPPEDAPA